MLRKLLKYEFKATGRGIIPLYGALLFFALMVRFFVEKVDYVKFNNEIIIDIIKFMSVFLYGATMAAIVIATILIIVQRYYKNILGDEGYLMNTIPVSIHSNITAKLIVSTIWCCLSGIVALFSIFVIFITPKLLNNMINHLFVTIAEIYNDYGFNFVMISGEFILAGIAGTALVICLLYASVSLGHLLPKMKMLGAFGAFLLLNLCMNIINIIGFRIFVFHTYIDNYFSSLSYSNPVLFAHILGIGSFMLNALWVAVLYFITYYILKNRLNLE